MNGTVSLAMEQNMEGGSLRGPTAAQGMHNGIKCINLFLKLILVHSSSFGPTCGSSGKNK